MQRPNIRPQPSEHEIASRREIARRLAALKGFDFDVEADTRASGRRYYVPDDTLTVDQAAQLGIGSEDDLFGGVVPYPFVATKAITHPLLSCNADAPAGWSHALGSDLRDCVVPGYTAFDKAAARAAGLCMLSLGPVRIKAATGIGGSGQYVVADGGELEAILDRIEHSNEMTDGVIIEQHLEDITTYCVGQVHVGALDIAYCGTQALTQNNSGEPAYGGSQLYVVRGDLRALLDQELSSAAREAVVHARQYDTAIQAAFPGLLASRRNYDVIRGRDAQGGWASGVLEQSWRLGGATPAEIGALEAFQADSRLNKVTTASVEAYGDHETPAGAVIYFDGIDRKVGRIVKYGHLSAHENPP